MTYHVDILNPKAVKLLQDLADLDLISIKETGTENLLTIASKIRAKASKNPPSFDAINKEVEIVRAKRYDSKKK